MSPFEPGEGRKPRIGPEVCLRLPQHTIDLLDQIIHYAHRRYQRLPRKYKTRSSLIRHLIEENLDREEARAKATERV